MLTEPGSSPGIPQKKDVQTSAGKSEPAEGAPQLSDRLPVPIICVDGPSGSGKGTLAEMLAARLGFRYLDSGALYRTLAVLSRRRGIDISKVDEFLSVVRDTTLSFEDGAVLLNGEDLSSELRQENIAALASELAAVPEVRAELLESQRACADGPGLVADGRDMGTAVFPEARLKIFLTASAQERARRRLEQLDELAEKKAERSTEYRANRLINKDLNEFDRGDRLRALVQDIELRDERDRSRKASPLHPAADAIQIDSTNMSIDEVLEQAVNLWKQVNT